MIGGKKTRIVTVHKQKQPSRINSKKPSVNKTENNVNDPYHWKNLSGPIGIFFKKHN